MKIKCLNCGYEFDGTAEYDELGWHSSCPECESSFDVDTEDYENTTEIDGVLFDREVDRVYQFSFDYMYIKAYPEKRIEEVITKALRENGILVVGAMDADVSWSLADYGL